ncbi:MAG: hypothetical protein RBR14_06465 [Candidatus Cloacimonas acidaminovorans]|nr:hypothetical protein [Candidatus Cloacimonas acidaminovorans]
MWQEIQQVLMDFVRSPIVISTIIVIVGIICSYLKIPKWVSNIIIKVIQDIFQAVIGTEELSKEVQMTSEEKLNNAIIEVKNSPNLTKTEKILLNNKSIVNVIEKAVLPVLQKFWKKK